MKFEYKLDGSGWAEGFIELSSQRCYFTPSYLSDALGDLLNALVSLLINEPDSNQFNTFSFIWEEEPACLEWLLTREENENVTLIIKKYYDIYSNKKEKGSVLINATCRISDFITEILRETDSLLLYHGIVGYKESWINHEFPLSNYLKLKHYLGSNKQMEVENIINKTKWIWRML